MSCYLLLWEILLRVHLILLRASQERILTYPLTLGVSLNAPSLADQWALFGLHTLHACCTLVPSATRVARRY